MGQLSCVICGGFASQKYPAYDGGPSCNSCDVIASLPYAIWDLAVNGPNADADFFEDKSETYTRHNWHNHPSVVARRQEVGGRVDMTSKWPGPLQMPMSPYAPGSAREYTPILVEKAAQCGFTESIAAQVASGAGIEGDALRVPMGTYAVAASESAAKLRSKPVVKLVENVVQARASEMIGGFILRPAPQTTHTFSAELPDGSVVTMPSPGDDWVAGETVEYKRGDMCVDDTDDDDLEWMKHHALVGNSRDRVINFSTDLQKCWFKEFVSRLYYGTPILSIATWVRTVQPPAVLPESYDYYCPSRENTVGLEIWPGDGDA